MPTNNREIVLEELITLAESSKASMQEELSLLELQKSQSNFYLLSLYMRASEIFDGIIVLAKSRVPVCGYILNRTLAECFAYAKASVKDPEFYRTALNKHLHAKVKRTISLRRDLQKLSLNIGEEELREIENFNKESIDAKFKILSDSYQLFEVNGLQSLYHQVFAHCSLFAHNDSHTLDRYIDIEVGKIVNTTHFLSDSILNLIMATKIYFELYLELVAAAGSKPKYAEEFVSRYNAVHDKASEALERK